MLEFLLCSLFTLVPDYLYRRYRQGKRWGAELNPYTIWFELRWGITSCLILTISLITAIFYYHPSTTNVLSAFRTVTILSEGGGRVSKVFVENNQLVKAGDPIFEMDGKSQKAAAVSARARIAEVDASLVLAHSKLAASQANLVRAQASYKQSLDEYTRKSTLFNNNSSAVSAREVERLENLMDERQAQIDAAEADLEATQSEIDVLIPAQKASAEAALGQARAELAKLLVVAGVDARIEQFALKPGDVVNPILRPAGILVPMDDLRKRFHAGFNQITNQVIHVGMLAEMTCVSAPMRIIPMVVVDVQDVISSGQIRPTDVLVDLQDRSKPGTLLVVLEPLYQGQTDHVLPGSKCIMNAYTNNHERLQDPDLSFGGGLVLHMIDTVGIAHAFILRLQALMLPVQVLVFSGH